MIIFLAPGSTRWRIWSCKWMHPPFLRGHFVLILQKPVHSLYWSLAYIRLYGNCSHYHMCFPSLRIRSALFWFFNTAPHLSVASLLCFASFLVDVLVLTKPAGKESRCETLQPLEIQKLVPRSDYSILPPSQKDCRVWIEWRAVPHQNCELWKILVLCKALEYYYRELESFAAQHFTFTSCRTLKMCHHHENAHFYPLGQNKPMDRSVTRTEWRAVAQGKTWATVRF